MLIAAVLATIGIGSSGNAESADGKRKIVIFGASWCAPCRAEMDNLDSLANAAAPYELVVAWLDREPRVKVMPGVTIVPRGKAQELFDLLSGSNQGLPFNVSITARGTVCSELRERLNATRIARLQVACDMVLETSQAKPLLELR